MQAARLFLVDVLLAHSSRKLEVALPCLTAALTAWPHALEEGHLGGTIHGSLLGLLKVHIMAHPSPPSWPHAKTGWPLPARGPETRPV